MMRHLILFPLAFALSGCVSKTDQDSSVAQPAVSEIARGYKSFNKITKNVVLVNPEFAMLCAGASRQQVDSARARFGPHANTGILVYMNQLAADAFATKQAAFPTGAVIVKEKTIGRSVDGKGGVGGMVKRAPGYNPMYGDWEYFYFVDPDKIESGRIPSCAGCHASAKDRDHVFGTWLKAGN